jgi:hypothetical protein
MNKRSSVLAAGVLGTSLWVAGALRRSLWTDEFHCLYHIRKSGMLDLLRSVRTDNHPPLSFFLERVSVAMLGESALALRLPSIVAGVLFLIVLSRLAAGLSERGRMFALWTAALSSFSLVVFSEARMYSWLALAVCGMTHSVWRALSPGGKKTGFPWGVALWVTLGLYSHYYFAHYLFVMGVALCGAGVLRPELRNKLARCLVPFGTALLLWLPWVLFGFLEQLNQDYPAGGHESGVVSLAQGFYHLLFMNTGFAGVWFVALVALPAALLGVVLGVLGVHQLFRRQRKEGSDWLWLLAPTMAFLVPCWAMCASGFYEKASFGWRYIAGSLGPLAVLIGASEARFSPIFRRVIYTFFFSALAGGVLVNLIGGEREDYRGAVAQILEQAKPGDAVVVKPLWDLDPQGSPNGWDYYSRRFSGASGSPPEVILLDELKRAHGYPRVWIFQRDPYSAYALHALRQRFAEEERDTHGLDLILYLFSSRRSR